MSDIEKESELKKKKSKATKSLKPQKSSISSDSQKKKKKSDDSSVEDKKSKNKTDDSSVEDKKSKNKTDDSPVEDKKSKKKTDDSPEEDNKKSRKTKKTDSPKSKKTLNPDTIEESKEPEESEEPEEPKKHSNTSEHPFPVPVYEFEEDDKFELKGNPLLIGDAFVYWKKHFLAIGRYDEVKKLRQNILKLTEMETQEMQKKRRGHPRKGFQETSTAPIPWGFGKKFALRNVERCARYKVNIVKGGIKMTPHECDGSGHFTDFVRGVFGKDLSVSTEWKDIVEKMIPELEALAKKGNEPYKFDVISGDTLQVAHWEYDKLNKDNPEEEKHKRVGILNMACWSSPGGGYKHGAAAQEENIVRRTNLIEHLKKAQGEENLYPMALGACHVSKNVIYFRGTEDDGYPFLPREMQKNFQILSAASYNKPPLYKRKEQATLSNTYAAGVYATICAILQSADTADTETVVLSALGCGAYGNPAEDIALLFKLALLQNPPLFTKRACFAILGDFHTGDGNIKVFSKILNEGDMVSIPEDWKADIDIAAKSTSNLLASKAPFGKTNSTKSRPSVRSSGSRKSQNSKRDSGTWVPVDKSKDDDKKRKTKKSTD